MKRLALIAVAAVVPLSGIGAGAYWYWKPGADSDVPKPLPSYAQKDEPAANSSNAAAENSSDLARLMEQLGVVQDRVVRGDHGALEDQNRLLVEIADILRHFDKTHWTVHANVRRAFVYVLSGGEYGVLQPLADNDALYEADRKAAEGIMLYAQGKESAARKLLGNVDPRSLDVGLVGPFALAQASFYIGTDNSKAIALLDEARLACPHTAIEEAAVRREIPVLVDNGNIDRAMLLMADYLRRFGRSIYARRLFDDFSIAMAKRDELDNSNEVDKLNTATSAADTQPRIDLFLAMAREALPRGRIALAKSAARHAKALSPQSAEELDRAALYEGAADAPSTRAADALGTLRRIALDRLSSDDTAIHQAAGYIAETVTRDGIVAGEGRNPDVRADRSGAGNDKPGQIPELIQMKKSVESADAALKNAEMAMSGNVK
jgi:chemotaxis protein MotC